MTYIPRYPRVRSQWREFVTPAIRNLVLACVGVFLIQTLLGLFNPAGYRVMIREFGHWLQPFGSTLALCRVRSDIRRILGVMDADNIPVFPDRKTALLAQW